MNPPAGLRVLLIEDSSHFQNLVSMLVKQRFPMVDLHIANDNLHCNHCSYKWRAQRRSGHAQTVDN